MLQQLGGNVLHAVRVGLVHAKIQLQTSDFGGFLVGGRLMVQQVMQNALAQRALCDFQLGNAQQVHHGHHHADAASHHGAAVFFETGNAQLVHMADVQQLLIQMAQLGWRDDAAIQALCRERIGHRIGRAG